jgi:hypothetical protein
MSGEGKEVIPSHHLKDTPRLVDNYGPGEWVKMETKRVMPDGNQISVDWFKNKKRGKGLSLRSRSLNRIIRILALEKVLSIAHLIFGNT